ncbi:MAG: flavin reductase family protein, partial [Thermodesulfobacteriota bacterium]
AVQVSSVLIDSKGRLQMEKGKWLAYAHGQYFALGKSIGHFGYSIRKRRKTGSLKPPGVKKSAVKGG